MPATAIIYTDPKLYVMEKEKDISEWVLEDINGQRKWLRVREQALCSKGCVMVAWAPFIFVGLEDGRIEVLRENDLQTVTVHNGFHKSAITTMNMFQVHGEGPVLITADGQGLVGIFRAFALATNLPLSSNRVDLGEPLLMFLDFLS